MGARTLGTNRAKPPLGVPLNRNHKLAKGLVGGWVMNEGGGGTLYDLSGYANNGTLADMASPPTASSGWNLEQYGNALAFDGTNDYVALPNVGLWDFGTGSFSILGWFRTGASGYRNIIRYDDGVNNGLWGIRTDGGGKINFIIADSARQTSQITSDDAWNDNLLHLAVAVRDAGDGELRLYLDGISAATPTSDGGRNVVGALVAWPAIGRLGARVQEHWSGFISDVRLYDRALSAQEVMEIYVDPYCMFEQPMVWGWVEVVAAPPRHPATIFQIPALV